MNLLVFASKLKDEDRQIIWFWMNRLPSQYHGENQLVCSMQTLLYDRQKVLAKAREYLDTYSRCESSRWNYSSTYRTYEKLLKLMEEVNEKDTKVRAAR